MTPAGIEPANFRFVAKHLNYCATSVPSIRKTSHKCKLYWNTKKSAQNLSLSISISLSLYCVPAIFRHQDDTKAAFASFIVLCSDTLIQGHLRGWTGFETAIT